MVAAEFGSNKREGNRRRTGEGDFGVARKGTEKGGFLTKKNKKTNKKNPPPVSVQKHINGRTFK